MLEKVLQNVPMHKVIAMGVGSGVLTATAFFVGTQGPRPSTMTREWDAATQDYRRYQNMDRIGLR